MRRAAAAGAFLALVVTLNVMADSRVHVIMRAFIPRVHSGNPGYVRAVPGMPSVFVIPNPVGSSCFVTDNRLHASDNDASARMTTEFDLVISSASARIEPHGSRPIHSTGQTREVNCETGADVEPPANASTSDMHLGTPAFADGVAEVVIDGRANNPLFAGSPAIRYGGSLTFNAQTNNLRFRGSVSAFPAFEAYVQLDDGTLKTVTHSAPP